MSIIKEFKDEYRWLSNFWPVLINVEGITYHHVEGAYMAMKTTNIEERRDIALMINPGMAKRAGKQVTLRPDWDKMKVRVMYNLLKLKFAPGSDLASKLLATENALLIEGNAWNDTFWGVCKGQGQNRLGLLLMRVRNELKENDNA